jgi:hypothetical protein
MLIQWKDGRQRLEITVRDISNLKQGLLLGKNIGTDGERQCSHICASSAAKKMTQKTPGPFGRRRYNGTARAVRLALAWHCVVVTNQFICDVSLPPRKEYEQ